MQDSDNPITQLDSDPKKFTWERARQLLHHLASEWKSHVEGDAEAQEMLNRRARLLAKPPEDMTASAEMCRALLFTLGGERYAVPAEAVRAVRVLGDITRVPGTPAFYLGVVNVRGKVISAIDLRLLFGMPVEQTAPDVDKLKLLIVVEGAGLEVSLVGDEVLGVADLPWASLSAPGEALVGISPDYITGTTADGTILLDLEALLSDARLIVNEEVV